MDKAFDYESGIPGSRPGRVDILLHIIVLIISLNRKSNNRLDLQLPRVPVALWIRHLNTNQGIPSSSPGRVDILLHIVVWIVPWIRVFLVIFMKKNK